MKPARTLCLLLFLAVAFIGMDGGTASATVLCGVEMPTCPSGSIFGSGTEFSAKLATETKALFTTSTGTVACEGATIKGKTSAEEGEPLSGELTSSTFSKCSLGKTACTAESADLPFKAAFTYAKGEEETGDGTIELSSGGKGEPIVILGCTELFSGCTYSASSNLSYSGGEPGEVRAAKVVEKLLKGASCPKEATFTATYVMTSPESAFLVQARAQNTKLCQQEPTPTGVGGALKCNAGQGYSGAVEFTLTGVSEALFTYAGATIKCNKVTVSGNFQENGEAATVLGGLQTFNLNSEVGGVVGNCTSTLGGTPRVGVTMQGLAYNQSAIAYLQPTADEAAMGIHGANGAVKIQLAIGGGGPTCVYNKGSSSAGITNGSGVGVKSTISLSFGWAIAANQPNTCGGTMGESMTLRFEQPLHGALYVARE